MGNGFEQVKYQIKNIAKKIGKKVRKVVLPVAVIALAAIIILSGSTYVVTVDDGSYAEEEGNVMYEATEYTQNVTIADDGTINTSISAQDLWDQLIQDNSRVDVYLDSAAELQKLMNAEVVTNYPDTRSEDEIDEPLDEDFWNNLNKDVDSTEIQGIIKFKRAESDGTTTTMTYVDYDTFFDWIEEYNYSGSDSVLEDLLTHFTIEAQSVRESSGSENVTSLDYSGTDQWTDISEAIVTAALASYDAQDSPGEGMCQAWVRQVYTAAGLPDIGYNSAYEAFQANCISTDTTNIPIGAAVYGTGSAKYKDGPNIYGHVGIYIGDIDGDGEGEVMDNVGDIQISSLSEWIEWQEEAGNTACGGTPGFLGWGWQSGSPTRFLTDEEVEEVEERIETEEAVTVDGSDDSSTTGANSYYVIVANYSETTETIESNDPDVTESSTTTKTASTQTVDYQSMVSGYQMPFDYLWEWIVAGRDKDFGLDVADLVYGSTIEITIHDNETKVTDVDTYEYTEYTKYDTHDIYVTGTGTVASSTTGTTNTTGSSTRTVSINEGPGSGTEEVSNDYTTVHTTITVTDTLDVSVTTADVWIVSYSQEFEYEAEDPETTTSDPVAMDENTDYPSTPDASDNEDPAGIGRDYQLSVESRYITASTSMTCTTDYYYAFDGQVTNENTVETKKYIEQPKVIEGKDDPNADEENFVTLLTKGEHYDTLTNVTSAPDWLYEMMESSEKTVDMIDLTKYLLYKATGKDFGVTEFDFSIFDPDNFSSVGSTYGGSSGIDGIPGQIYDFFLAKGVPPAGVAAIMGNIEGESSFDTSASNGTHFGLCQWGGGRYTNLVNYANSQGTDWTDLDTQLEFCWQELEGSYSKVKDVLMATTEESDIEYATWYFGRYYEVFFTGTNFETSKSYTAQRYEYALSWYQEWEECHTEGGDIVSVAKSCHDYLRNAKYSYSKNSGHNTIPLDESGYTTVDCSSFVTWVLYEYGYTDLAGTQQSTRTLYSLAVRKGWEIKSGSEAEAGDILLIPNSHTCIYAGNGYGYDCGSDPQIQEEINTENPSAYTYSITVTAP